MEICSISSLLKRGPIPPGTIFISNRATKEECFRRQLFGLPSSHSDIVERVKVGRILFLFEHERRLLYGVFEATSDGATKIVPSAFDKSGKAFTAQVRFQTLWPCYPLTEAEFSKAIKENYYERRKFHLELSKPLVYKLLRLFEKKTIKDQQSYFEAKRYPLLSRPAEIMTDIEDHRVIRRDYESSRNERTAPSIAYPGIHCASPHRIVRYEGSTMPVVTSGIAIVSTLEEAESQLDLTYPSSREILSPGQIIPRKEEYYPNGPEYSYRELKSPYLKDDLYYSSETLPNYPISHPDQDYLITSRNRLVLHEPLINGQLTSGKDIPTRTSPIRVHDHISSGFLFSNSQIDLPSSSQDLNIFPRSEDFFFDEEENYNIDLKYLPPRCPEMSRYSASGYEHAGKEMLKPEQSHVSGLGYIVDEERSSVFKRLSGSKFHSRKKTVNFISETERFKDQPLVKKRKVELQPAHDVEIRGTKWTAAKSNNSQNRRVALDDDKRLGPSAKVVDGGSVSPDRQVEEETCASQTPVNFKRRSDAKRSANQVELDNFVHVKEGEAHPVKTKRKRLQRPSFGEDQAEKQEPLVGTCGDPDEHLQSIKKNQPSDRKFSFSASSALEMKEEPSDECIDKPGESLEDAPHVSEKIELNSAGNSVDEMKEELSDQTSNEARRHLEGSSCTSEKIKGGHANLTSEELGEYRHDAVRSVEGMKVELFDQNSEELNGHPGGLYQVFDTIKASHADLKSDEPSECLRDAYTSVEIITKGPSDQSSDDPEVPPEDPARAIEKIKESPNDLNSNKPFERRKDGGRSVDGMEEESFESTETSEKIEETSSAINSDKPGERLQNMVRIGEKVKEEWSDIKSDETTENIEETPSSINSKEPGDHPQDADRGGEEIKEEQSDTKSDKTTEKIKETSASINSDKPGERPQDADRGCEEIKEEQSDIKYDETTVKIKETPTSINSDERGECPQDVDHGGEEIKEEPSDPNYDEPGEPKEDACHGVENIKENPHALNSPVQSERLEEPSNQNSNKPGEQFQDPANAGEEEPLEEKSDQTGEYSASVIENISENPADHKFNKQGIHLEDEDPGVEMDGESSYQTANKPSERLAENPTNQKSDKSDDRLEEGILGENTWKQEPTERKSNDSDKHPRDPPRSIDEKENSADKKSYEPREPVKDPSCLTEKVEESPTDLQDAVHSADKFEQPSYQKSKEPGETIRDASLVAERIKEESANRKSRETDKRLLDKARCIKKIKADCTDQKANCLYSEQHNQEPSDLKAGEDYLPLIVTKQEATIKPDPIIQMRGPVRRRPIRGRHRTWLGY